MTGLTRTLNFDGTWAKHGLSHVSLKRGQVCFAESRLELDAFLLAEFDDKIVNFKPQPISFTVVVDGKKRRYTPDVLFQNTSGAYVLKEVKPDEAATQAQFLNEFEQKKWHVKREWDIELSLLTKSDIHVGETIANYKRLYYYKRFSTPEVISRRRLRSRLGNVFSFRDLKAAFTNVWNETTQPQGCIAWGQCRFDIENLLGYSTELELV